MERHSKPSPNRKPASSQREKTWDAVRRRLKEFPCDSKSVETDEHRSFPRRSKASSSAPISSPLVFQSRQNEERQSRETQAPAIQPSPDWSSGSLQPAGLFNREATRGSFSLGSILNASDSNRPEVPFNESRTSHDDPIRLGLITLSIAMSLFANFMTNLNPYISQLDPQLHTFDRVRQQSPFLLTAILAAAAKAFNPALHQKLRDHAEDILSDSFRTGIKSVETAQAIMIMTYWKESEDTRAWMLLGYVIRMGMELGWDRLTSYSPQRSGSGTDLQNRQARNIERTWFVLFVYDRSMSLQTGKPWMIERSELIESIGAWCRDAMATPGDRLLDALVTLRLLSSEVFKLLCPRSSRLRARQLHSLESLLAIIKGRVEEWESRWLQLADKDTCHPFLIQFYGTHLRLQLFSLPLQDMLAQSEHNVSYHMESFWVSYSSALEMLHLICRHSSWLYFAQDSIHVMTAYSAAFLTKLLLSTSDPISRQIEVDVHSAISGAELVFSQQAAPSGSSCALQSRFLSNMLARVSKHIDKEAVNKETNPSESQSQLGTNRHEYLAGDAAAAPGYICSYTEGGQTLGFADDETWAGIMAEAGFNAQDGVFFA
ncbi:fungal specific transcription factor domain-containing protein [Colletotrichum graminicola M1.001]|uniref:Fungal specific transcription factor domain-containing protein n=1 Tax=Colletotrichum graminicola (strain M1.001 / M2 / FGSC 10212) TaxID=645133 RepID=E3QVI6_COLGM|nr:fungal specific transcription factor domain-containing protein [Colletotrichum graminicola M1.001]EFQ34874.1 fungal specific transcription factor domain-containing protein [Colletotrichum graminicola M1.001]